MNEEFVGEVATQTNNYNNLALGSKIVKPKTRRLTWRSPGMAEIFCFLAAVLLMGIVKKSSYKKYWTSDPILSSPIFSKIMPLNRFVDIMGNLHFYDILPNNIRDLPADTIR